MIGVESRTEGFLEGLFNHGKMEGRIEERKNIINHLLKSHSRVEVAELLGISLTELMLVIEK